MFLQIVEQRTGQVDEMMKLEEEWRAATEGKRTIRRSLVARDRNDPNRYLVLAFFDDEKSAAANSALSETAAFADKQSQFLLGVPTYTDLDVIKEVEY
jgi:hypothetical protein